MSTSSFLSPTRRRCSSLLEKLKTTIKNVFELCSLLYATPYMAKSSCWQALGAGAALTILYSGTRHSTLDQHVHRCSFHSLDVVQFYKRFKLVATKYRDNWQRNYIKKRGNVDRVWKRSTAFVNFLRLPSAKQRFSIITFPPFECLLEIETRREGDSGFWYSTDY
jgi:hypothetical protein